MPDYKRFVAHIYLYDKGIRIKNVGFAKVNNRDQTCHVDIKLRGITGGTQGKCKAYFFKRNKEQLQGIHFGDLNITGGSAEASFQTPEMNLMESGVLFTDIGGIYIQAGSERAFATEWDDLGVQGKTFALYEKGNDVESVEVTAEEEPMEEEPMETEPVEVQEERAVPVMEQKLPERKTQMQQPQQNQVPEPPAAPAAPERQIAPELSVTSEKPVSPETLATPAPSLAQEVPISPEVPMSQEVQVSPEVPVTPETPQMNTDQMAEQLKSIMKEPKQPQAEEAMEAPQPRRTRLLEHVALTWEKMKERYPNYPAFQDRDIIDCIRVEPKDLITLPKKEWALGNNSFMLHGYYNYKYLLMGRKIADGRDSIILGVPGVYHNQEKMMANMFGFPYFKQAKSVELKAGVFGYWYRVVSWGE